MARTKKMNAINTLVLGKYYTRIEITKTDVDPKMKVYAPKWIKSLINEGLTDAENKACTKILGTEPEKLIVVVTGDNDIGIYIDADAAEKPVLVMTDDAGYVKEQAELYCKEHSDDAIVNIISHNKACEAIGLVGNIIGQVYYLT